MHGTNGFARRVLAMHARHGLEIRPLGFRFVAFEVSIDANPVHRAPARDLFLADNRNVVLGLTSNHARVAADATVQVDRHAPRVAVALILVIEIGIEREFAVLFGLLCALFTQRVFLFQEFIDRSFAQDVAIQHVELKLRRRDGVALIRFARPRAGCGPGRI